MESTKIVGEAVVKSESKKAVPVQGLWGLGVLGSFICFGWMNNANTALGQVGHWQYIYAVLSVSLGIIAVTDSLVAKKSGIDILSGADASRFIDWTCALVMAAAVLMLALASSEMLPPLSADAATILGGLALGWQYARWSRLFASCSITMTALSILGAATLWPLTELAIALLPFAASSLVVAFFASAVIGCLPQDVRL